jgi:hypothetical protein
MPSEAAICLIASSTNCAPFVSSDVQKPSAAPAVFASRSPAPVKLSVPLKAIL